jgi:hypothetical protein
VESIIEARFIQRWHTDLKKLLSNHLLAKYNTHYSSFIYDKNTRLPSR